MNKLLESRDDILPVNKDIFRIAYHCLTTYKGEIPRKTEKTVYECDDFKIGITKHTTIKQVSVLRKTDDPTDDRYKRIIIQYDKHNNKHYIYALYN